MHYTVGVDDVKPIMLKARGKEIRCLSSGVHQALVSEFRSKRVDGPLTKV